jgi:hypothetical protein
MSLEQLAGVHLDRFGESFKGRDLRIALPGLDPADLPLLDAAAVCDLFLGQFEFCAGGPQVLAKDAHIRDRRAWRSRPPCKVLHPWSILRSEMDNCSSLKATLQSETGRSQPPNAGRDPTLYCPR